MKPALPLLTHDPSEPSVFTPEALMESVRGLRNIPAESVPKICVLEFDGDLTDWLVRERLALPFPAWPCFHTSMYRAECDGIGIGIVARTIGGPYAVLVAEQLAAAGAQLIVGLTSAGRVSADLPLPCLVVASSAIRDEGASCHYLPPGLSVDCRPEVVEELRKELSAAGLAVRVGPVWTTDAPYRETASDLRRWAEEGVLAVEMQAASLFAFGQARKIRVGAVAMVSNAVDHDGGQFDTGGEAQGWFVLQAIARAGRAILGG